MSDEKPPMTRGYRMLLEAATDLTADIEDDGRDISKIGEKQVRGLSTEEMQNCPLVIGGQYSLLRFDFKTKRNEIRSFRVTGIFFDGYAYVDL